MKDRFGLPPITRLLAIVSTFPLCSKRVFTLLVLRYFVRAANEGTQLVRLDHSEYCHDIRVLSAVLVGADCRTHCDQPSSRCTFYSNSHVRRVLRCRVGQFQLSNKKAVLPG
jgi:hypothetical protein